MNMLSWAVYVSDYSRYLPRSVSASRTYWAVFGGNALGACLYGGLGIYITALAPDENSVVSLGSIAGKWILPIMALSLLGSDAMNAYTGMLGLESVRSTFQKVAASRISRVIGLLAVFAIATVLAETGYRTFLTSFENFIDVLLFFFVPWSVINLVDFYIVKKGRYDVASFFTPKGIYGGWRWTALIPYAIALGAQVPFIDQTLYVGPMVKVLGGADISWLVGFVVGGAGYLIATRITSGQVRLTAPEPQGAVSS
jgi:NCS1 family nucleobase:cation symporter-1